MSPLAADLTLLDWTGNLLDGLAVTVIATGLGLALMIVLSVVFGLLSRVDTLWVRGPTRVVVEFFRGSSLLVQLWWLYFALPLMLGVKLDSMLVAMLALGLNYGSYGAEVVRGSINAVPQPQWEAATALNLSRSQRMRRVVWPQAFALMIPSMNNLFIQLLKSTPLLYTISLVGLMTRGEDFRFAGGNQVAMYVLLSAIYFVLAYVLTGASNIFEGYAKARLGQERSGGWRRLVGVFRQTRATGAEGEVA